MAAIRFISFIAASLLLSGCLGGSTPPRYVDATPLVVPPAQSSMAIRAAEKPAALVDFVVVQKSQKLVSLWKDGRVIRTYPIMALGANPIGHKVYEGDERTPEGQYEIDGKHVSNNFQYFLNISYPNERDKQVAKKLGKSPGGHVGLHGDRGGVSGFFQRFDKHWTDGCIAMRNDDIIDLYTKVEVGTPILLKP